jgi:3-hydroxyacyl-CoA dehydrogenase
MLTGKQLGAAQAAALGLVDRVVDERADDLTRAAVAFARERAAAGGPYPKARLRADKLPPADAAGVLLDALRVKVERQAGPLVAPRRTVEAVAAGILLGYEAGRETEMRGFAECLQGAQARGLIHFFFASRATANVSELRGLAPRAVRDVAVIGGGTMGRDIAYVNLAAGRRGALVEANRERLDAAAAVVREHFARRAARGEMSDSAAGDAVARLTPTLDYAALATADLVIEAVVEVMEVKREVFARVAAAAPPDAILASNTSTLPIGELARGVADPGRVVGLHFFSPARVMKLLEVVRAGVTSPLTIATALAYAREVGKTPVLVGDVYGFVSNRLSMAYGVEAAALLEEGASVEQIDGALVRFGMPMGPLQMSDMAGVDVGHLIGPGLQAAYPERYRPSRVSRLLYDAGRFGQKTGRGYYRYEPGQKVGASDPEFETLLADARRCSGTGAVRTNIGDDEIVERVLYATVNEGAHCLGEGVARTPGDVDVVFVLGFGFPAWRGGPMRWAEEVGWARVVEALDRYADTYGERLRPAGWLREQAASHPTALLPH